MKFSIIVPVYNVEKYLTRCLNSIINQTYSNYEVIVVCDNCSDKSESIVDEYIKKDKRFKKIYEENTGLGKARNIGVDHSLGDYILFLDGDDFYNDNLLETLKKELNNNLELLRFQVQEIKENQIIKHEEKGFDTINGLEAFHKIFKYHYIENAWCYCYEASFYKKNNFRYMDGCIAEDYGLTPLILAKAKKVKSISYIGYNYVQRENSLMTTTNYHQKLKKMEDMIKQAIYMKEELQKIKGTDLFMAFVSNSLIYYSTTLKYQDYKKYRKIMKNNGFYNYLIYTNLKQKIKSIMIKQNAFFFYNCIMR